MRKTFIYCDEFLDLGFLGQHELTITALNVAQPHEEPRLLIKRAVTNIRFKSYPMQVLDVTLAIRDDYEWLERVNKSYRQLLESQLEEPIWA